MRLFEARECLEKIIKKGRVHLYKPIQVAEILHRDRTVGDIDLSDLESYRTHSRRWRDDITMRFLGTVSTSSARYQDDVFNDNATPPVCLVTLGEENRKKNGIVEAYVYRKFAERHTQMNVAVRYCKDRGPSTFDLDEFIGMFWNEPGLKRSIDKVYEVIVYALFEVLVETMGITVEVSLDETKLEILSDFEEFAKKVLGIDQTNPRLVVPARFHRVGVTNAADRGLDMWANYGPAVQIKHISLNETIAENIVGTVTADRIVIVCMDSERRVIVSLLSQIGWRTRIQSIITQTDLIEWYGRALGGTYSDVLGERLLHILREELMAEFPSQKGDKFEQFLRERGYDRFTDPIWTI